MKTRIVLLAFVALAIGLVLSLKHSEVTPGVYRFGFFLGLASVVGCFLLPGGQMYVGIGRERWKRIAFVPIGLFLAAAPFVVLTEAGFAGYLGFTAFMRYVSLAFASIGLLGLSSSFAMPYLLRRRSTK
jgi:hypothetical protein